METGCTNNESILHPQTHKTQVNNCAKPCKNDQYIHNGKGTSIITRSNIKSQKTRDKFNSEKTSLIMVKLKLKNV